MAKGTKLNASGLPADRRDNRSRVSLGTAPSQNVPLAGSGYDRAFTKPGASVKGAGKISSNKAGNGGRKSTVKVGTSK